MWRPARAMVARAYGKAFTDEEVPRRLLGGVDRHPLGAATRGDAMTDDELRSYILTAVASHASKEMRRRARKPAGSLDDAQEQVVADADQLLPGGAGDRERDRAASPATCSRACRRAAAP